MQRRIDVLHAEIDRLVAVEKAYEDRVRPLNNTLWQHVRDTNIEVAARSPRDRSLMHEAVASLRP